MAENAAVFPVRNGVDLEAELQRATDQLLNVNSASRISDPSQAYAINIVYDRIRDVLMEKRDVWEQWKFIYWQRKYHSYLAVYERLEDSLKEQFMGRMQQEFRRAMQTGQLDRSCFGNSDWKMISTMIRYSDGLSGVLRGIPVLRVLAPYIPKTVKRALARVINWIVKAKE